MAEGMHKPVLCKEVVELLDPQPGRIYVDGTVGLGGHSLALLDGQSDIRLVGVDKDEKALEISRERLSTYGERVHLIHGSYCDTVEHLEALDIEEVDGFFVDLGLSSLQLDDPSRGFSFRLDGPLDMRMDMSQEKTASDLVNGASRDELVRILREYGQERFAVRIAGRIASARSTEPIKTTGRLAEIVRDAIPRKFHPRRIDPATRAFQALRIAVNDELENLKEGLEAGFSALKSGGVMAVISFHSLEDRMVKRFFRYKALDCVCPPDIPECVCDKEVEAEILTRKPIRPSEAEMETNPRSRSAKLRACRRIV